MPRGPVGEGGRSTPAPHSLACPGVCCQWRQPIPLVVPAAPVDTPHGHLLRVVITQWTPLRGSSRCSGSRGEWRGWTLASSGARREAARRVDAAAPTQRRGAAAGLPRGRRSGLGGSRPPLRTARVLRRPAQRPVTPGRRGHHASDVSWRCSSRWIHQGRRAAVVLADDRRPPEGLAAAGRSGARDPNGIDDFPDGTPTDAVEGRERRGRSVRRPGFASGLRATRCRRPLPGSRGALVRHLGKALRSIDRFDRADARALPPATARPLGEQVGERRRDRLATLLDWSRTTLTRGISGRRRKRESGRSRASQDGGVAAGVPRVLA